MLRVVDEEWVQVKDLEKNDTLTVLGMGKSKVQWTTQEVLSLQDSVVQRKKTEGETLMSWRMRRLEKRNH